jgi:hypothetical protein
LVELKIINNNNNNNLNKVFFVFVFFSRFGGRLLKCGITVTGHDLCILENIHGLMLIFCKYIIIVFFFIFVIYCNIFPLVSAFCLFKVQKNAGYEAVYAKASSLISASEFCYLDQNKL